MTTASLKPQVNVDSIPDALRAVPRWLVWRYETRNGKQAKVPCSALTGKPCDATKACNHASFDAAVEAVAGFDGLGFALGDGFAGIDLDDCFAADGEPYNWARYILEDLGTYAELSPSGDGLKLFMRGRKPGRNCKCLLPHGQVEVYDGGKFFTVTGQRLKGAPSEPRDCTDELSRLYSTLFPPPTRPDAALTPRRVDMADAELTATAGAARNGAAFTALWEGKWRGRYPSQSEADLALCSHLAFWTGSDAARMDRLVRLSALYRLKWDERHYGDGRTYGEGTIQRAIDGTTRHYSPADERVAYGNGFLRTSRATLLFDALLRSVPNPTHRGFFRELLLLAWPMSRWGHLGCLRAEGKGPLSGRALARRLGYSSGFVAEALRALQAATLIERVTVGGARYWRIVDYASWVWNERELLSVIWTAIPREGAASRTNCEKAKVPKLQGQTGVA